MWGHTFAAEHEHSGHALGALVRLASLLQGSGGSWQGGPRASHGSSYSSWPCIGPSLGIHSVGTEAIVQEIV